MMSARRMAWIGLLALSLAGASCEVEEQDDRQLGASARVNALTDMIVGANGIPARQDINEALSINSLALGSFDIVPGSPTSVGNCIPFGDNTDFGFTGFIYKNVSAFNVAAGDLIRFDLGDQNDQDIRRDIYFSVANQNPAPGGCGFDVTSQGIKATTWVKVVSTGQNPANPTGNTISGDYELTYTAEAAFSFPGGGLIVGFSGSPPAAFPDGTCDQVLVQTSCDDSSGLFYGRFFFKADQTLDVLDTPGGGTGVALGGMVIVQTNRPPDCSAATASPAVLWPPNHKLANINVVGVTDPDGDPVTITATSVTQDESTNGTGDGDTCPDAILSPLQVRAERAGSGDGRVYRIDFTADDGNGGTCSGTVNVSVPHDQSGTAAEESSGSFNSLVCP